MVRFHWLVSCMAKVAALVLVLIAVVHEASTEQTKPHKTGDEYDIKCNLMVQYAQQAAKAFNEGRTDDAEIQVAKVVQTFNDAVAMYPDEMQAYANFAIFCLNTHR
jgi:hypothetical protein